MMVAIPSIERRIKGVGIDKTAFIVFVVLLGRHTCTCSFWHPAQHHWTAPRLRRILTPCLLFGEPNLVHYLLEGITVGVLLTKDGTTQGESELSQFNGVTKIVGEAYRILGRLG